MVNTEKKLALSSEYNTSQLKRTVDILVSLAGLPPTLLAITLIGLAIMIGDSGDIIFRQKRIGKGGKEFTVYKLRTFKDGEKTTIGQLIRPLAIDELPQFWNIFKGDMSLFGIRAMSKTDFDSIVNIYSSDPNFDDEFLQLWKDVYLSAKPGGLSLAVARAKSVFYRGYQDNAGVRLKMEHDIEQVQTASFKNEMKILFMIISKALRMKRNSE